MCQTTSPTLESHIFQGSLYPPFRDLRLEGSVFGDAAKVGLECLRPVSEAVASSSAAPGSGEVQKLVFVLQLIEKMTDLFSGGLGGGYSHQGLCRVKFNL